MMNISQSGIALIRKTLWGSIVRNFHWIVIFQLLQKGIKSNDTKHIELARDKK